MNLKFYILNPANLGMNQLYHSAYHTFKETWSQEFGRLFGSNYTYSSNDFTRQSLIQALFLEDQCIALDCIRKINLRNPADLDDSWLKPWGSQHLKNFVRQGYGSALINSYFTVHADHRRTKTSDLISVSFIMGCLSVLHQVELGHDLMLGMMRQDRSMNALGKSWGGETIESGVLHNAIPTDLVAFKAENIQKIEKSFPSIVREIFEQKINLSQEIQSYEEAA